jgi:RHS repeat-associated protein
VTTYPAGGGEAFTYDADNNMLTRQTRAGQTISFTYDTLNRLATKTPPAPAPVVSYGYDLAGHLTSVSDTSAAIAAAVPPSGASIQYATSYSYDATNRTVGVSWNPAPAAAAPSASSVTFGHAYNAVNQRVGQSISDNSWVNYPAATVSTVSYTANALNQYTAVGPVSPSYDGNGNLTSDGTFTFGYDAENRLTSASGAGNSVSYAFDAQGRRKTRTVNGATTVFVTDADNREVLEYDGTSGAIQRWYAYNLGPNDVLNQTNVAAGTRATLIPDIQGSIIASLDSGSGSLSKLGYLPYGKSASAGPFGFTGQRVDVEMGGLYYYRARHYSPAWGRFAQVDPSGTQGGINLYRYVANDPLNLIDPRGLTPNSPGEVRYLSVGDIFQSYAAGAVNTLAQSAVNFGYYSSLGTQAEAGIVPNLTAGPLQAQAITPVSNYFASEGATTVQGVSTVVGAAGLGGTLAGAGSTAAVSGGDYIFTRTVQEELASRPTPSPSTKSSLLAKVYPIRAAFPAPSVTMFPVR